MNLSCYVKRDLNKECNQLQKTKKKLMKEYAKTVLQLQKKCNNQNSQEQYYHFYPITNTNDKNFNNTKNNNNNKLFIISSKKTNINNAYNNNGYNTKSSSSSSSLNIYDSENSLYINQLRNPPCHISRSSTSSLESTSRSSSPSITSVGSSEHRSSSLIKIVRFKHDQIKSLSQIPDHSIDKNIVPLSMNALIARNLPVIESKFPITRLFWMKNVSSNY